MKRLFVIVLFLFSFNVYSQTKEALLDSLLEYKKQEKALRYIIYSNYVSFKIREAEQNETIDSLKREIIKLSNKQFKKEGKK